jgi:radical SAM protein with 4Fe4S-binding SPASM domain
VCSSDLGFGEPLLNKNLPEMIRLLKEAGVTDFVEFTTNGWWLTPDLNKQLIDAGLDAITISVPGLTNESIKKACGKDVDFDRYVDNINQLYLMKGNCRIHIKITNYDLSTEDEQKFYNLFENICDEISVDNVVPIWNGIDGEQVESTNIYREPIRPVEVCPYIFYHLTVHANGDVSTCFVDWEHRNVLGNVEHNTLKGIWNSLQLHEMRVNHLRGLKDIYPMCMGCRQLVFGQADNIDKHAGNLLKRLS